MRIAAAFTNSIHSSIHSTRTCRSDVPLLTNETALVVLCGMLFPSCLISDLACMSYVSAFGILATALSTITILFTVALAFHLDDLPHMLARTDFCGPQPVLMSGIIIGQACMHSFLPSLRGSMKDKGQAPSVVNATYLIIFAVCAGFTVPVYITYGPKVDEQFNMEVEGVAGSLAAGAFTPSPSHRS